MGNLVEVAASTIVNAHTGSEIRPSKRSDMAFAYMFRISVYDDERLQCEFEGGDPDNPKLDMIASDGRPRKEYTLSACLMSSEPVPQALMASVPKRIVVKPNKAGRIPDFGYDAAYGCFIVSDRAVDVIEGLEPKKHQFLHIPEAVDVKGQPLPRRFYLMNVLTRLAGVDKDRSTVHIKDNSFMHEGRLIKSEMLAQNPGPSNAMRFFADRAAIGNHHLWRGNKYGLMSRYYCTHQLREAMERAGLTPLNFHYALE